MLLIYYNLNSFCVPDFQKMCTEDNIKKAYHYAVPKLMSIRMAYIRCQNYILLLIILLCDIYIAFCYMHGLFCYLISHYAIFILHFAT